jgi:hypothetical protein
MQTFLPYPDIAESVKCLDNKRLGKQRVEAKQILNVLMGKSLGWKNHPAVLMWKGYENALISYMNFCIVVWKLDRGFKNNMINMPIQGDIIYPNWFGDDNFHKAHRSALLLKNYDWYKQFGWTEEPKIDYYWPVKKNDK